MARSDVEDRPERSARPVGSAGSLGLLPWLAKMRSAGQISAGNGMYQVFGHDAARRVLSDPAHFSSDLARLMPGMESFTQGKLTMTDPPEHRRLRRLVGGAFTPRRVAALGPRIERLATDLLPDRDARMDFMEAVGAPLPMLVIADLLGIPQADLPSFRGWADRLISLQVDDPSDPELPVAVDRELHAMDDMLADQCAARRRSGATDDLLGLLTNGETDGERLEQHEVMQNAALLLLAGHITTTLLLGNLVLVLGENPGLIPRLNEGEISPEDLIEEVLRLRPPFVQASRVSCADTTIDGVRIEPNRFVQVWILSANRDPEVFADPDSLRPGRRGSAAPLTFGHGIHFCVGAALARLEAGAVLGTIVDRYRGVEIDADAVEHYPVGVLGPRQLPVHFT